MEEDLFNAMNLLFENTDSSSSNDNDSTDTSSSSTSTDEDQNLFFENERLEEDLLFPLLQLLINGRRRQRVQNFLHVVHAKSNQEFREDFRLNRRNVYTLLESLEISGFVPTHAFGKEKKPAELCLLMTLWFLSNKEPHRTLSNLFDISISSVFRIIRRVINWLLILIPDVIKWPQENDIIRISRGFEEAAGICNCIGAIDGSHFYIEKPEENGKEYFNRKQCYSILLQAVTDCNTRFTNVYCGDPGSFHDGRMLRRSQLFYIAAQERENTFPNSTFLLGDKGYNGVAKKWIVCPFKDNGNLTREQQAFNNRICVTRVVVEKAFDILKGRFRQLHKLPLRDVHFMTQIIVSCCVLHNICLDNEDNGEDFYDDCVAEEPDDLQNYNNEREEMLYRENFVDRRILLFNEMYP